MVALVQARLLNQGAALKRASSGAATEALRSSLIKTTRTLAAAWTPPKYSGAQLGPNPALSADELLRIVKPCPERHLLVAARRALDKATAAALGAGNPAATEGSSADAVAADVAALAAAGGRAFLLSGGVLPCDIKQLDPLLIATWHTAVAYPCRKLNTLLAAAPAAVLSSACGMGIWAESLGWREETLHEVATLLNKLEHVPTSAVGRALAAEPTAPGAADRALLAQLAFTVASGLQRQRNYDAADRATDLAERLVKTISTDDIADEAAAAAGEVPVGAVAVSLAHNLRRVRLEAALAAGQFVSALKQAGPFYAEAHPTARGQRSVAWHLSVAALATGDNSLVRTYWAKATEANGEIALVFADDVAAPAAVESALRQAVPHLEPGLEEQERERLKRKMQRERRKARAKAAAEAEAAADAEAEAAAAAGTTVRGERAATVRVTRSQAAMVVEAAELVGADAGKDDDDLDLVD